MNEKFKLEKELLFKNNIKSIVSISLDRDFKVDNNNVVGNFIITGEYKIHELSINKERFDFKIPFKHELNDGLDRESIKVEITNFVYDYSKDELVVNVEYVITGDRSDVFIFDDNETLDEFLSNREVEVVDTRVDMIKNIVEGEEVVEEKEEVVEEKEEVVEEKEEGVEKANDLIDLKEVHSEIIITEDRDKINEEEVLNNIGNIEDKFVTYKVYKVSETDTLESIVLKFNISIDELKEYNDLININSNDKIIIPYYEQ